MTKIAQVLQQRLIALGFPMPLYGADGDFGAESIGAVHKALDELEGRRGPVTGNVPKAPLITRSTMEQVPAIPVDWMPAAKMDRIICHWTAGANKASSFDGEHYHILIEDDGKLVRGIPSIKLNEAPVKKGYAAHTLNCNSGSIGVSLCCMGGSTESPFNAGKYPMTQAQWDALTSVIAQLAKRYGIAVTDKTVLSHAEVQNNLGIAQRGKWDFTRLAFDPSIKGAKACGDKMRAEAKAKL
ncbi:MAG: peptidoglycan recognition family protein [Shinella sp.]|nr:peptidoglycan recognition family protein [Shinella sp.]